MPTTWSRPSRIGMLTTHSAPTSRNELLVSQCGMLLRIVLGRPGRAAAAHDRFLERVLHGTDISRVRIETNDTRESTQSAPLARADRTSQPPLAGSRETAAVDWPGVDTRRPRPALCSNCVMVRRMKSDCTAAWSSGRRQLVARVMVIRIPATTPRQPNSVTGEDIGLVMMWRFPR